MTAEGEGDIYRSEGIQLDGCVQWTRDCDRILHMNGGLLRWSFTQWSWLPFTSKGGTLYCYELHRRGPQRWTVSYLNASNNRHSLGVIWTMMANEGTLDRQEADAVDHNIGAMWRMG